MLIALPALAVLFQKVAWTLNIPQQTNRSAFTSRSQTIGTPGVEQWFATADAIAPATLAEAWAWDAFIAACRGSENTFHLPALTVRQTTAANPNVAAAVAGNRAVTLSSAANVAIGMYATVAQADGHKRLVKVVGIAGAQVSFEPALSGAPTIGAAFIVDAPYARMQLTNPDQPLTVIGEAFRLAAEEKL